MHTLYIRNTTEQTDTMPYRGHRLFDSHINKIYIRICIEKGKENENNHKHYFCGPPLEITCIRIAE